MNILTIPLRNLRRKGLRTLLMTVVFSVGIMAVTALGHLSETVGLSLEKKLTAYGANILISPRAEHLAIGYGGLQLGDVSYEIKYLREAETLEAIRSIGHKDRISAVAPKFAAFERVAGKPVAVIGVDWESELAIKSFWAVQGELPQKPEELLAGSKAAAALGLAPGAEIVLGGGALRVAGVLESTGSEDDNVLFMDLHALQKLHGKENLAHYVEVAALCAGCPIEEITAQLAQKLPDVEITAMQQVVKQRMMTVDFVKQLALSVSVVILLTACVMIALSIFSSVNERKSEIGVLRAVGFSRGSIFFLFSLEALLVGLLAGLLGYAGGFAASVKMLSMLELTRETGATLAFDWLRLAATLSGVAGLAAASAAWPAFKAAQVEPSQALVML